MDTSTDLCLKIEHEAWVSLYQQHGTALRPRFLDIEETFAFISRTEEGGACETIQLELTASLSCHGDTPLARKMERQSSLSSHKPLHPSSELSLKSFRAYALLGSEGRHNPQDLKRTEDYGGDRIW